MTERNDVEYIGVWELDGKYCVLLGTSVPDWVGTGTVFYDDVSGAEYEVVEYRP